MQKGKERKKNNSRTKPRIVQKTTTYKPAKAHAHAPKLTHALRKVPWSVHAQYTSQITCILAIKKAKGKATTAPAPAPAQLTTSGVRTSAQHSTVPASPNNIR